jgi:hypothetical protein
MAYFDDEGNWIYDPVADLQNKQEEAPTRTFSDYQQPQEEQPVAAPVEPAAPLRTFSDYQQPQEEQPVAATQEGKPFWQTFREGQQQTARQHIKPLYGNYETAQAVQDALFGERGALNPYLEWLDKPLHTLGGFLHGFRSDDPHNPLGGALAGALGETHYNAADTLGVKRPQPEQPWYEQLARGGAHLAADMIDPVFLLPGAYAKLGKTATYASKIAPRVEAFKEYAQGSGFGKTFMPNLVKTEQYKDVMPLIDELTRKHSVQGLNDMVESQLRPTYSEAVKELESTLKRPLHPGEAELAFQYSGGETMPLRAANPNASPVQLLAEEWANAGGVPKEYDRLIREIQKIADLKAKSLADRQAAEEMVGVPVSKTLSEETGKYIPKVMEDPAQQTFVDRLFGRDKGGKSKEIDPNLSYDKSAEYKLWVNDAGELETQGMLGKKGTGVMSTPEGTVLNPKWIPGDPIEDKWLRNKTFSTQEGIPVAPWNAPLADVMAAAPYRKALTDPLEAFRRGIAKDEAKTKFMELTRGLEDQGLAVPTTARMQKEAPYPTTKTAITDVGAGSREFPNLIPERHRIANVAGMEGYSVPKGLANYLENAYGIDEGAVTKWRHGSGKPLEDANQWWRNNVLPFFTAWGLGNIASSAELAVMGGMNLRSLPGAAYKTGRTIYGDQKAMSMIPGISNLEAKTALGERRQLTDTWSELNAKLARKQATDESFGAGLSASLADSGEKYGGKMRRFSEVLAENEHPTLGKIAGVGADVGEFINRQGKRGFWLGGQSESLTRSAQAMDWIRKEYPGFSKLSQIEKDAIWDRAVNHASEAAVNYNVTPMERNIKNLVMPFYPWLKGSTIQTVKGIAQHPERIQKMQHLYSNFMLPMSPEEQEGMTDDEKNKMLIRTILGRTLQNKDPNTRETLPAFMDIGRFRPYQTPLQFAGIRSLPDAAKVFASGMTPNLKGVAEEGLGRTFFGDNSLDQSMLKPGEPGGGPTVARDRFFGQPISAMVNHLISSSPGGRILSQAQAPYNYLHSKLFKDPDTGLGIPGDPNKPEHGNLGDVFLNQLIGGKTKTIDVDAKNRGQDYRYQMEKQRLTQGLNRSKKQDDEKGIAFWQAALERLQAGKEKVQDRRGLKGYGLTGY